MYEENYNLEQLLKIKMVLQNIKEKNIQDVDAYLKRHLNEKEIILAYSFISKEENKYKLCKESPYNKIDPSTIKTRPTFKLEWEEITPYTVLGIEEKDYTKEELLDIIGKKINFIQNHGIDKQKMKQQIDEILDAYNEIIKTSSKKR